MHSIRSFKRDKQRIDMQSIGESQIFVFVEGYEGEGEELSEVDVGSTLLGQTDGEGRRNNHAINLG